MLLPVYLALAAAIVFYVLIPIAGAFRLRNQWRHFRERIVTLEGVQRLSYHQLSAALRSGKAAVGCFRLSGTIDAIEGDNRLWVRGSGVSALVDLSRAPLYVLDSGDEALPGGQTDSIQRLAWASVSSLVEGTRIYVAGELEIEDGLPVFVDKPDAALVAVCHGEDEQHVASRLIAAGRAQNEYWNNPTRISMAIGLVVISAILLAYRSIPFSSVRALIFLTGASPVLPFAPPGVAFFFIYRKLWRQGLEARTTRDLLRLPLLLSRQGDENQRYLRRFIAEYESIPPNATQILLPGSFGRKAKAESRMIFVPPMSEDPVGESFIVEGDPEELARKAEQAAFLYLMIAGITFSLAFIINYILAFLAWRSTF